MAPKMVTAGAAAFIKGDFEIALLPKSELLAPGIDFVGTLPQEIQLAMVFSAAVMTGSKEIGESKKLVSFLASEKARPAIERSGMEPSRSR